MNWKGHKRQPFFICSKNIYLKQFQCAANTFDSICVFFWKNERIKNSQTFGERLRNLQCCSQATFLDFEMKLENVNRQTQ